MSEPQIATVCAQSLSALDYLHSRKKIHRDIKGANILIAQSVGSGSVIKLTDFGASKPLTDIKTMEDLNSFKGTPYYMVTVAVAGDASWCPIIWGGRGVRLAMTACRQ